MYVPVGYSVRTRLLLLFLRLLLLVFIYYLHLVLPVLRELPMTATQDTYVGQRHSQERFHFI